MSIGGRIAATSKKRAAGFTLVELLVALAVFSILSMLLFDGLRFGIRAWELGTARIDRLARIEPVQNLLRYQLNQATLPYDPTALGSQAPVPPFVGSNSEIRFIAPLPGHTGTGGLYRFYLSAQTAGTRRELQLRWQVYRPDSLSPDSFALEDQSSLLDELADVQFSYYGSIDFPERPQWHQSWSSTFGLPQLIRIRVSFPPGDPRRWPDLVVAPMVNPREL